MVCENLLEFVADIGMDAQMECSYAGLARASVWQGNSITLVLLPLVGGAPLTDIAAATDGLTVSLRLKDKDEGFSISLSDPDFQIDTP